jgi:uncharacterized glyoxalase superfamily protein PhnB
MSTIPLAPFIDFQGRAREAMAFYRQVLGGALALETLRAQGNPRPAGSGKRVGWLVDRVGNHWTVQIEGA